MATSESRIRVPDQARPRSSAAGTLAADGRPGWNQSSAKVLIEAEGTLYANIGRSRFWVGAAESYGVLLARSGLLSQALVDDWRAFQARSVNYYTYLTRRPQ
jgi:hypothetical protein